MSLFDQIMSAVANPQQQGSTDQIGNILGVAQQVAGNQGLDSGATQAVMSMLGGYVRSSLQNTQAHQGRDQAQMLVNQYAGLGSNPQAVDALFPGAMQQQVAEGIAQRIGLNSGMVQSMLPVLVPLVLNMLRSGAPAQGVQAGGGNSVLNAFLDADRDGDVDMGDVMGMAGQYLNQRR